MDSLMDRIRRSVAQRGFIGTAQLCVVQVLWIILPRFRRTEAQRERVDAEFDRKYGVDTGGVVRPKADEVVGGHWAFGGNYQAVDPSMFLNFLGKLNLPFPEFTFIDFGSGKGRTLLLASFFPFSKIVGVEYCRELNRVARQNAGRFWPAERVCLEIEVQDGDAAEYPIPDEPLVLYLYHPFSEQVMSKVIQNVVDSYRRHPRRIVVVYFFPQLAALWEATGVFQRTHDIPAIFDTIRAYEPARNEVPAAAQAFVILEACFEGLAVLC
jgi:hypothetical protein